MDPLLIIALSLGLVVSAAALLYPFWPFGRRWRALLVAATAFVALALSVPGVDSPTDGETDTIAESAPVEIASTAEWSD